MSPIGPLYEYVKRTLNLLLEAYMREKGIRFYALGGFTIEETSYSSANLDDSYSIGSRKIVPDIVIEVIITSGTLDKRELYKPKQVPEIWFGKSNQLRVFSLREGEYVEVERSPLFPDLDLELLRHYLGYDDQYDAVNEFVQNLQKPLVNQALVCWFSSQSFHRHQDIGGGGRLSSFRDSQFPEKTRELH